VEEPKTITYLINLAIDTKEIQKKTVTIHFKEHSIEEYLQWKNYLQNESLENKLKYLETILGSEAPTGLFIIEKVLL
jgi:hypothetical protein